MKNCNRTLHAILRSTALCSATIALLCPLSATAFNPSEGANELSPVKRMAARNAAAPPLANVMPKLVFPESTSRRQIPVENQLAADSSSAPAFLPVADATAARANQEIQASTIPSATIQPADNTRSFVAPAPLGNIPESSSAPVMPPAQEVAQAVPTPVPPAPAATMSDDSKKILGIIPSKLNTPKTKAGKLSVDRMSPQLKEIAKDKPKVESFDATGLSIKVQRPGLDTNFELERAYTALMGGDTELAISTYKNILTSEPENEDALFGLAATYHRLGKLDQARPYYGTLLKVSPNHREGLNNFLALVSEESPQEALAELERLEQRNPDFSPIPAQQAVVLNKLGFADQAREKMMRAIELAPENLTYKYNLAVLLDKNGRYADAGELYRLLIDASLRGEKIPASTESLQKRLNFIAATNASAPSVGG